MNPLLTDPALQSCFTRKHNNTDSLITQIKTDETKMIATREVVSTLRYAISLRVLEDKVQFKGNNLII